MNGDLSNNNEHLVVDPIIPVSVTLPKSLVERSDVRAKSMDMTRSQYFRKLAREDLFHAEKESGAVVPASRHVSAATKPSPKPVALEPSVPATHGTHEGMII